MLKYLLKGFSISQSFDLWAYELMLFHPETYIKLVKFKKRFDSVIRFLVPTIDKYRN